MRRYVTVALLLACMMGMAVAAVPSRPRAKTGAPSCVSPIVSMQCNLDSRTGYVSGIQFKTLAETEETVRVDSVGDNWRTASGPERLVCASGASNAQQGTLNAGQNVGSANIPSRLSFGLVEGAPVGGDPTEGVNVDFATGLPSFLIARVEVYKRPGVRNTRGKIPLIRFGLANYLDTEDPTAIVAWMACGQPVGATINDLSLVDSYEAPDLGDNQPRYLSGFGGSCYKRNLVNNPNDAVYYLTGLNKLCWVRPPVNRGTLRNFVFDKDASPPEDGITNINNCPIGIVYWKSASNGEDPVARPIGIDPPMACETGTYQACANDDGSFCYDNPFLP